MRQRNSRHSVRQELLQRVSAVCADWRFKSEVTMMSETMAVVSESMMGAFSYVGLLEHGSGHINFLASTAGSIMTGQKIKRGEGVSFDVVDQGKSKVFREPKKLKDGSIEGLTVGSKVDILYSTAYYKGSITRVRGHDTFDVVYDFDKSREAGVIASRLKYLQNEKPPHKFRSHGWPFVCVPVCHNTKVIGVLGMDSFEDAPITEGEHSHPESSGLQFLDDSCLCLGMSIDMKRKHNSMTQVRKVSVNRNSVDADIWNTAFSSMHGLLLDIDDFLVVYWDDFKEGSYEPGRLHSRTLEHNVMVPKEIFLSFSSERSKSRLYNIVESMDLRVLIHQDMETVVVQNSSDYEVVCLWKLPVPNSDAATFVTWCTYSSKKIPLIDVKYFHDIGSVLHSSTTAIRERGMRFSERERLVDSVSKVCNGWNFAKSFAIFLLDVINRINRCYFEADIYIGIVQMGCNQIKFVASSSGSAAYGRLVRRGNCVTMKCIDNRDTLIISNDGDENASLVDPFVTMSHIRWPFVAVPLVFGGDGSFGVLASDGIIASDASDNMHEVRECLQQIGNRIGIVFAKTLCLGVISRIFGEWHRKASVSTVELGSKKEAKKSPSLSLFKEYEDCVVTACPLISSLYIAETSPERSIWIKNGAGGRLSLISDSQPCHASVECSLEISKLEFSLQSHCSGETKDGSIVIRLLGNIIGSYDTTFSQKDSKLTSAVSIKLPIHIPCRYFSQSLCNRPLASLEVSFKSEMKVSALFLSSVDIVRMCEWMNLGVTVYPICCSLSHTMLAKLTIEATVDDWREQQSSCEDSINFPVPNAAQTDSCLCHSCSLSFICILDNDNLISGEQEHVLLSWDVIHDGVTSTGSSTIHVESKKNFGETFSQSFGTVPDERCINIGTGNCEIYFSFVNNGKKVIAEIQGSLVCLVGGLPKTIAFRSAEEDYLNLFLFCRIIPVDPSWEVEENSIQQLDVGYLESKESECGYTLTLLKAEGLARPSMLNDCDPQCDVLVNRKVVGTTKVLFGACNPVWEHETFSVEAAKDSKIVIAVFDMELGGLRRSCFLGQAEISSDIVCHPPVGVIRLPLMKNADMPSKSQTLVQGDIYIKLQRLQSSQDKVQTHHTCNCSFSTVNRSFIRGCGSRKSDAEVLSWETMFPYTVSDYRHNYRRPFTANCQSTDGSRISSVRLDGKPRLFDSDCYVGRMSSIVSFREGIDQRSVDKNQILFCSNLYSSCLLETMLFSSRQNYFRFLLDKIREICTEFEEKDSNLNMDMLFSELAIGRSIIDFVGNVMALVVPILQGASAKVSLVRSRKQCMIYAYPQQDSQSVYHFNGEDKFLEANCDVKWLKLLSLEDMIDSMLKDELFHYPSTVIMGGQQISFPILEIPIKTDFGLVLGIITLSDLNRSRRLTRTSSLDVILTEFMVDLASLMGNSLSRRSVKNGLELIEQSACLSNASIKSVLHASTKAIIGNLCQCHAAETWLVGSSSEQALTTEPLSGSHNEFDSQSQSKLRRRLMSVISVKCDVSHELMSMFEDNRDKLVLRLQSGDRCICLPMVLDCTAMDGQLLLRNLSHPPKLVVNNNRKLLVDVCACRSDASRCLSDNMSEFWKDLSRCVDPSIPVDPPSEAVNKRFVASQDLSDSLKSCQSSDFIVLLSGETMFRTFMEKIVTTGLSSALSKRQNELRINLNFDSSMISADSLSSSSRLSKIGIDVISASNLAKSDTFGSSDPLVECYFNNSIFGVTKTIKNCLNPIWNESFEVLRPEVRHDSGVTILVWDMDTFGKGSLLGEVVLPSEIFLNPPLENCEYVLQASRSVNKKVKQIIQGSIILRSTVEIVQTRHADIPVSIVKKISKRGLSSKALKNIKKDYSEVVRPGECDAVVLEILQCDGLTKADMFGKSDPIVVVTFNGSEIGCTKTKFNTLNPRWDNEKFSMPLPKSFSGIPSCITLQVWDMDLMIRNDFLGQAHVSPAYWSSAGSDFGSIISLSLLQKKPSVPCQGTISFRICRRFAVNPVSYDYISPCVGESVSQAQEIVPEMSISTVDDYQAEVERINVVGNLDLPDMIDKLKQAAEKSKNDSLKLFGNGMINEVAIGQLIHSRDSGRPTLTSSSSCDIAVIPFQYEFSHYNFMIRCAPGKMDSTETLRICSNVKVKALECLEWIQQRDLRICAWNEIYCSGNEIMGNFTSDETVTTSLLSKLCQVCMGKIRVISDLSSRNRGLCALEYSNKQFGSLFDSFEEFDFDSAELKQTLVVAALGFTILKFRGLIRVCHSKWKSIEESQMRSLDDCKSLCGDIDWDKIECELAGKSCLVTPAHTTHGIYLGALWISDIDSQPYLMHALKNGSSIRIPETGFMNACRSVSHVLMTYLTASVRNQDVANSVSCVTQQRDLLTSLNDLLCTFPVVTEMFLLQSPKEKTSSQKFVQSILNSQNFPAENVANEQWLLTACNQAEYGILPVLPSATYEGCSNSMSFSAISASHSLSLFKAKIADSSKKTVKTGFMSSLFRSTKDSSNEIPSPMVNAAAQSESSFNGMFAAFTGSSITDHWVSQSNIARLLTDEIILQSPSSVLTTVTFVESGDICSGAASQNRSMQIRAFKSSLNFVVVPLCVHHQVLGKLWEAVASNLGIEQPPLNAKDAVLVQDYTICLVFHGKDDCSWFELDHLVPFIDILLDCLNKS